MLFDIRTVRVDGWCLLSIVGELDLASMPVVRQELERVPGEHVALDLRGVDYVDPVTLGVVLTGALRATRRSARFAVVCPPGRPRDLLAETRLDQILTVVETPDQLEVVPGPRRG